MNLDTYFAQLGDTRATGATPDGKARAVVDGTGRLVELTLAPELLRQQPKTVANAVLLAVGKAQEAAKTQGSETMTKMRESLQKQIAVDVEEAGRTAERHLTELNTLVSDLMKRDRAR
jgi:DNA-binding protein YbaB